MINLLARIIYSVILVVIVHWVFSALDVGADGNVIQQHHEAMRDMDREDRQREQRRENRAASTQARAETLAERGRHVDDLLRKIVQSGLDSLSQEERALLDSASSTYRKESS